MPGRNRAYHAILPSGNQESHTVDGTTRSYAPVNEANEYPSVTIDGGTPIPLNYDRAGNLTLDELGRTYTYDEENRLVTIKAADLTLLARYEYDALGRRIIFEDPVSGVTTQYYYDGQSVIEERNASGTVIRTHVHGGQYIDEHIVTIPGTTGSGKTANDDESYYYLLNDLYTVVALGDEDGNIAEDYEYSASGLSEIGDGRGCLPGDIDGDGVRDLADEVMFEWVVLSGDGTARMLCAADMNEDGEVNGLDIQPFYDCLVNGNCPLHACSPPVMNTPYTLHGRPVDRLSDGLTLQYNRARYYDITNGRWLQRDPKGYVDGGNLYEAFGGNPRSKVDPNGTDSIIEAGNDLVYQAQGFEYPFARGIVVNDELTNLVIVDHATWPFAFVMKRDLVKKHFNDIHSLSDARSPQDIMRLASGIATASGTKNTVVATLDKRHISHYEGWVQGIALDPDHLRQLQELGQASRADQMEDVRTIARVAYEINMSLFTLAGGFGAEFVDLSDEAYEGAREAIREGGLSAEAGVVLTAVVAGVAFHLTLTDDALGLARKARRGASVEEKAAQRTVIGRWNPKTNNIQGIRPYENSLLKHLPNRGSPKLNWEQNSRVLRIEMRKGLPIRDAHVDSAGRLLRGSPDGVSKFIDAERNLLRTQGWTYDPTTTLWSPPVTQ